LPRLEISVAHSTRQKNKRRLKGNAYKGER
jgi:hypothetical protein